MRAVESAPADAQLLRGQRLLELAARGAGHDRNGLRHRVRPWRDDRHTPSEADDVDPVGELEHVRHVVADQDHGEAPLADTLDQGEHLPRLLDSQRGGRLVHDHDPPRPRRGPRHRDTLPLAAGQGLDRLRDRPDADLEPERCSAACRRIALVEQPQRSEHAAATALTAEEDVGGDVERRRPAPGRPSRSRRCAHPVASESERGPRRAGSRPRPWRAPESVFISVVLPAPLSPMMAEISPG